MFDHPDNREDNTEEIPTNGEYRYTAQNNPGASGNVYHSGDSVSQSGGQYGADHAGQNNRRVYYQPPQPQSGEPNGQPKKAKKARTKPPKPPKPPRQKKSFSPGSIVALALICAIVGGLIGGGAVYAVSGSSGPSKSTSVAVSDRTATSTGVDKQTVAAGEDMTSSQIYDTYSDAVVCITVETSKGTGAGTGFIMSKDGYIMTCQHVVDGASAISVTLNNATSYEATLVGSDKDQDFAVLKIDPGEDELTAVVLGDSSLLGVGDSVTVIGNALGTLANTLTTGVVSALDRAITMSDGTVMSLMQTDCTINSGNSGGPLFNQYGEVVGIVNAKYSSSAYDTSAASIEGIGFAIPINDANEILEDLMKYGYVTGKPYLGISVSTISAVTAQQYANMVVGAYVNSVNEGSCAETAGLKVGDIITQVDGNDITSSAELIDAKNTHKAGEEMRLTVYRPAEDSSSTEANYMTIVVTLDEEKPEDETAADDDTQNSANNGGDYDYGYGYGYGNGNGNGSSGFGYGWPFSGW